MNLKKEGFDIVGYDGNPYTAQLTNGFASSLDLSEKQELNRKFDWAQSFEVG